MTTQSNQDTPKKILLSGVFGPFGVDDEFGRKENIMELFHNQVTRGQGLASYRLHHRSAGLYFMAANVNADVNVLDFPTLKRFVREIKKGYDIVGISFIAPNFVKAKEMARLIRLHAPETEIVVGGHGAAIEGVEGLIDCDHVVKGEGVRWLRTHLGQDPRAPIYHPTLPASEWQAIYGVPIPGAPSNLLVPGVGCVNGCDFCATSHFFGKKYTPFMGTGREVYDLCCRIADERGTDVFFVMDENFLKEKQRALELIDEMERHGRFFNFYLFSSAETIRAIGIENMVRLGVVFVWVGFESKSRQANYEKNAGIEGHELVRRLRHAGITVLGSGILCLEEHTPENIQEDIDFMIGLEADLVQFMLYTPLPVTALYKRLQRKGLLKTDLPYEEWHGQKMMNWNHPAFPGDEGEKWLRSAFAQEYEKNSSSIYRTVQTCFWGYEALAARDDLDENLSARRNQLKERVQEYRIMLEVVRENAGNDLERARAVQLHEEISEVLGPLPVSSQALGLGARAAAALWKLRVKLLGDMKQPKTIFTEYPVAAKQKRRNGRLSQLERRAPIEDKGISRNAAAASRV